MALSDVNVNIINGGLGIQPATGTGIICKVGVSSLGKTGQIVSITDKAQVRPSFGTGPLANALADTMAGGEKTIYAVRAEPDVKGKVSAVATTATGTGTLSISGDPLDAYELVVKVTGEGALNSAVFQYSLDGGSTFSQRVTIPAGGTYALDGTGLDLKFAVAKDGDLFKAGDVFTATATAPTASIASINAAIDVLLDTTISYEGIHVCGASDKSLWVALNTRAMEAATKFRYIYIVAEAGYLVDGDDVSSWSAKRLAEAESFASDRVGVCAAFAKVTDTITGNIAVRNLAGIIIGWISKLKVQESAGKVILGSLPSVVSLLPEGINAGHIEALDTARYITVRRYEGLAGFYITDFRLMAEAVSDYQYGEFRRTMDKACKLVRVAALRFKNYEATDSGIAAFQAYLKQPLNTMEGAGEIAAGTVTIPAGQDILSTSRIRVKVSVQPIGIMRNIDIEIGLVNPFVSGGSNS